MKNPNTQMTIDKQARRWADSNFHKYIEFVPAICKNSLKHRLLQLKHTTRRGLSKILQFRSGHCMLNGHESKMDFETPLPCGVCQVKETPSHYLLGNNKFKKERKTLLSNISSILNKNKVALQNVTIEELLGG